MDFNRFDVLILGLSTWYDGDLQSDWENYFYGLAIDEDNQPELTQERITAWLSILEEVICAQLVES